jgi:hypothetical protein
MCSFIWDITVCDVTDSARETKKKGQKINNKLEYVFGMYPVSSTVGESFAINGY